MYRLISLPIYEQATPTPPKTEADSAKAPTPSAPEKKKKAQKMEKGIRLKGVEDVLHDIFSQIMPEKKSADGEETAKKESTDKKNESTMIKTFDQFVNEAKKEKWIADVDMKKGALRKEMGKKKGEKINAAEIAKSEAKLKKKDKDKKKPGLQLDKKDAKTHKRNVLAKNLMKASGAMHESKSEQIKGLKSDLVKIHEVVERMIKQTSAKK